MKDIEAGDLRVESGELGLISLEFLKYFLPINLGTFQTDGLPEL